MTEPTAAAPTAPMTAPTVVYTELTTTIGSPWTTGVQRVVREIIPRLIADDHFDVRPVVWCDGCRDFRLLTATELDMLNHPTMLPSRAANDGSAQQRLTAAAKKYVSPFVPRVCKQMARRAIFRLTQSSMHTDLAHQLTPVSSWEIGATFFEIEAGWQCPIKRSNLFGQLRDRTFTIVVIVNDVMPITNPEWFERRLTKRFTNWFSAVNSTPRRSWRYPNSPGQQSSNSGSTNK